MATIINAHMKTAITILLIFTINICYGQNIDNRISEIRKLYISINSNQNLNKDSIDISDESSEGRQLISYKDSSGNLRKLVTVFNGESGKLIEEFYISNDKLIFAFTERYDYNRPIYWDDKVAKENGDNVVFEYNKSVISENRYYFDNNEILIRWIDKDKKVVQDYQLIEKIGDEIKKEYKDIRNRIK